MSGTDGFIDNIISIAKDKGYIIEESRDGLHQIDFGNKKLNENHLRDIYSSTISNVSATIKTEAQDDLVRITDA